jgi:nucleoside-diphosphate-sugar epimerase
VILSHPASTMVASHPCARSQRTLIRRGYKPPVARRAGGPTYSCDADHHSGGHMSLLSRNVFITGGTGYIGAALTPALIARGFVVRALVRAGSATRLPVGAKGVTGDALNPASVAAAVQRGETIVHLIGTPHPNPSKALEFERVDLGSALISIAAAQHIGAPHFVYLSVAQPAPMMQAYQATRAKAESAIADARLTATVLRPWYVLGPGHRWPYLLLPAYAAAALVPGLRAGAQRLGLVTLRQMVTALVYAVENPPPVGSVRVVDVPGIRATGAR